MSKALGRTPQEGRVMRAEQKKRQEEYQTRVVRLEEVVQFIRNYDRGTIDKRNRDTMANAVRRQFTKSK